MSGEPDANPMREMTDRTLKDLEKLMDDPDYADRSLIREVTRRFTYHPPPDAETKERYARVTRACLEAALVIVTACPGSREKSIALTKLQEARMMANASIALNPRGATASSPPTGATAS